MSAVATLDASNRIFYESKNSTQGLADVTLNILQPDQTSLGPFTMIELANAYVLGTYYYDFTPTQVGDHLIVVDCPSLPKRAEQKLTVNRAIPFAMY